MHLVLKSCTIRPWRLDDAESLAKHANNRKIWLGVCDLFPHPYTIDDAHEFLQKKLTEQSPTVFCVEVDGAAVGGIGIQPPWVTGWAKSSGDAGS
jgi:ribosomal-protein-alanine N-acetyltransferase